MNRNEILTAIAELAYSQGFYGRLLNNLLEMRENDPDTFDVTMTMLEEQNFGDRLDMVLFFEC